MSNVTKGTSVVVGEILKKHVPLAVLILLFVLFFAFRLDQYLSFDFFSENRDRLLEFVQQNYVASISLYFFLYVIAVAASLPGGLLLTICGGFLFGWIVAGMVTVVAATIGATVLFLIAVSSIGDLLRQKAGPWLGRLEKGFQENAMNYLLFLRLVPAFPFWLVNIAPAFLGVSLRTYIIGTFFGIIPGTFVFAYLGTGLDSVIVEQQKKVAVCTAGGGADCAQSFDVGSLVTKEIILSFVALGVVSLIPIVVKRFRKI